MLRITNAIMSRKVEANPALRECSLNIFCQRDRDERYKKKKYGNYLYSASFSASEPRLVKWDSSSGSPTRNAPSSGSFVLFVFLLQESLSLRYVCLNDDVAAYHEGEGPFNWGITYSGWDVSPLTHVESWLDVRTNSFLHWNIYDTVPLYIRLCDVAGICKASGWGSWGSAGACARCILLFLNQKYDLAAGLVSLHTFVRLYNLVKAERFANLDV